MKKIGLFLKIFREKKAQISLEFLLILGIAIVAAIAVGFYLKQVSIKNSSKAVDLQNKSISGSN